MLEWIHQDELSVLMQGPVLVDAGVGGGGGTLGIHFDHNCFSILPEKKASVSFMPKLLTQYSPILYFAPILPTYLPSFGKMGGGGVAQCLLPQSQSHAYPMIVKN